MKKGSSQKKTFIYYFSLLRASALTVVTNSFDWNTLHKIRCKGLLYDIMVIHHSLAYSVSLFFLHENSDQTSPNSDHRVLFGWCNSVCLIDYAGIL